ncbi:hypothetical protein [Streptomyces albidoflavus]|uniref:hypothetical protein n=1 Tax=Streptomyces albidoflavus TaxID=1886 RepID=UPI002F909BFB|nr:hypothetical protein OHA76_00515 [Streptomyces albidoflavus]WSD57029.1 hypothetical protein OHA76_31685 [Streptomyces albidoflavus]WTE00941.1 hypothetical protein OG950_31280 [Streptomyces albidoflavus]
MQITTTALFLVVAGALAFWMYRDSGFKKREFLAVSLFWVAFLATPWGTSTAGMIQGVFEGLFGAVSGMINTAAK